MKGNAYCEYACLDFKVIGAYKYFCFQTDNRKEQITPTTALQFLVSCAGQKHFFFNFMVIDFRERGFCFPKNLRIWYQWEVGFRQVYTIESMSWLWKVVQEQALKEYLANKLTVTLYLPVVFLCLHLFVSYSIIL